ncbi:hypothetical protein C922_03527 [Plasmodium inui San Antonio 1]|uniref:Peptidase A1 domain-containing protein n=1 Tax=Plasmodium inui San Antonio 1 TaxID=1237626 RepID=W6ZYX0_9APIC|nr:hypothetical protein C922_03527 [Plasmodium inui San Antonio 1]EUD66057.1 hypothetical protein C922_03527 [Plasmodium inui San Antonio 1]
MITSIDVVHELLTTIYSSIFSRSSKDILKYDVLLYLDDYYYFDIVRKVSEDINELDPDLCVLQGEDDFNQIFMHFSRSRNYIIKDKAYENESERRIDFLHEVLADLLCLLYEKGKKGTKEVRAITKRGHREKDTDKENTDKENTDKENTDKENTDKENTYTENTTWERIKQELAQIEMLRGEHTKEGVSGSPHVATLTTNPSGNLDETYIRKVLNIPKEHFQNEDIIIKQTIDKETEQMVNELLEHLNVEYQMRYYYLFLNHYLTMQTLFMSPLIDLTSEELKKIVNRIVHIKRMTYRPVTIYDVLSFQYSNISFFKSSHDNLPSPVKKVKLVGETIERGGIPTTFSKKVIMKDVISANISLKEKYSKVKRHNEGNFGGRYKARNYYDSSRSLMITHLVKMGRIVSLLFTLAGLLLHTHNATVCSEYHLGEAVRKEACKFRRSGGGGHGVNFASTTGRGNSLVEAKMEKEQDYFTLKLNEHNFRWSVPLLMGSKKKPLQLGVVTSTPITALYCSYNPSPSDEMKDLKYEVNESEDVKYIGCRSRQCAAVSQGSSCHPIDHFLKMIHDFGLRKKSCPNRFCSYINDMNFLNVDSKLDKRNMSVCSFSSSLDSEHIEGFYIRDSFYLYDTVRCYYNYFGCVTQSDELKFNNAISGFIGLGYNRADGAPHSEQSPSMLHTLVQKSLSKKNIFGLCFVEGGGFASFGGVDNEALRKVPAVSKLQLSSQHLEADAPLELLEQKQATSHQIVWLPYSATSKDTYNLLMKEVNMVSGSNRLQSEKGQLAVVDSYSYFLSFPAEITAKLKTAVYNSCTGEGNSCSEIISKGVFTLKNQGVAHFPTVELVFYDGKVLIEPKDYLIHEGDGVYRVLINSAGTFKLGIPFFLNKYLIFDNENGKLGVGPSDCSFKMKGTHPGVDLRTTEADERGDPEDEDSTKEGFFQENKFIILALTSLSVVGAIVGGVFFFC